MNAVDAGVAVLIVALGWTLWLGLRRHDVAIVVNAVASLVAVVIPQCIELLAPVLVSVSVSFRPLLSVWIGVAGCLHMIGMIGWYDTVWWWDHVTHTVSAALIAALLYAWLLVVEVDARPFALTASPAVVAVILTLATGVLWEVVEQAVRLVCERLGIERVLKRYGRLDTPLDIVFDGVGALLVVTTDFRLLVPLFEPIPRFTRHLLYSWVGGLAICLLVSTIIVVYGRATW